MDAVAYYKSPVGTIEIRSDGTTITSVLFVTAKQRESKNQPKVVTTFVRELNHYFKKGTHKFSVPLSQTGTDFQRKVWNELLKIKCGTVTTYQDIARRIKKPKAVRAVANAIGANNLTIVVPCHRVIGSSGKLTGYSAGVEKKAWLLTHELDGYVRPDGEIGRRARFRYV